jgi:hypothetical protein
MTTIHHHPHDTRGAPARPPARAAMDVPVRLSDRGRKTLAVAGAALFSAVVLWADWHAGPFIRMPVLFAFPVMLASWRGGIVAGETLAVSLPLAHFAIEPRMPKPWDLADSLSNMIVLVVAFSLLAFLVFQVDVQRRRIRVLQGLLPVCSFCKRIRTENDSWEQMEAYIRKHSEAEFSHGVCPACAKREYDLDLERSPSSSDRGLSR